MTNPPPLIADRIEHIPLIGGRKKGSFKRLKEMPLVTWVFSFLGIKILKTQARLHSQHTETAFGFTLANTSLTPLLNPCRTRCRSTCSLGSLAPPWDLSPSSLAGWPSIYSNPSSSAFKLVGITDILEYGSLVLWRLRIKKKKREIQTDPW